MTVVGASRHQQHTEQIEIGGTAWTRVVMLDSSVMSTVADEEWAFVAFCDAGHVQVLGGIGSLGSGRAQMVVAFGDDTGPFADVECRQALSDARFQQLQTWPSIWVQTWRTSGRGKWPRARRPAIWARIDPNGDSGVNAAFYCVGASILAFKLDSIGAGNWAEVRYAPGSATALLANSRSVAPIWLTLHSTAISGVFDGSDEWLIASSVRYVPPSGSRGAPVFQPFYSATGLAGAEEPLLGRSENLGFEAQVSPLLGIVGIRYQVGGFALLDAPVNGAHLGARGSCPNLAGQQTQVLEVEHFAVRASAVLGAWHGLQKDPGTPPPAGSDLKPICIDAARTQDIAERELIEWTRPATLDIEVLACWSWRPLLVGPAALVHAPFIDTDTGGRLHGHGLFRVSDSRIQSLPEGVPLLLGRTLGALGQAAQVQLWAWTGPNISPGSELRQAVDFCFAAWCWENDPDINVVEPPAVPPATYLSLGAESLDVSLLPDLPSAPDVVTPHSVVRRGARLDAGDGVVLTWPVWLGTRRVFELTWSALDDSARDALLTVLAAQFRWTPPRGQSAVAFAPLGRARWTDLGSHRSTVAVKVAELIWTG